MNNNSMDNAKPKLQNIPTNIITGFLGVGKTTAILHLLKQKPEKERWAVLVNEFGEVGIDGSIYEGFNNDSQTLFVREVPGGCMCCAAGLPLQIALTFLLNEARPDRLLIEPTGLGHPKEVIDMLSAGHYLEVLDMQHTLTLVDARKVSDQRYRSHATFIQQLDVADIVVANKVDQYDENDMEHLREYLQQLAPEKPQKLYEVSMGSIDMKWLTGKGSSVTSSTHQHTPSSVFEPLPMPGDSNFPECGYLTIKNHGEEFYSQGWVFQASFVFDNDKLYHFFLGTTVERLKGTFITDQGAVSYNKAENVLNQMPINEMNVSRVECIHFDQTYLDGLEQELMNCLMT